MNLATNTRRSAEHDIIIAGKADIEQVCNILGSAFSNDPILDWISGDPAIYGLLFRSEAEALYKHHGHVYINREQTGAAMWLPAGVSAKTPLHWRLLTAIWNLARTRGFKNIKRLSDLDKLMTDNRPKEPHFYLHAIGASLDKQGRGIGSALLKAGLSACDQQGMPAYLESSNEKNNPLYERYGFEIVDVVSLPKGGPKMWLMRRESRLVS